MVTDIAVVTVPVITENVVDVEPCGTVTDAGILAAAELELKSDTSAPPDPAAKVRLTVAVPDWPPTIVVGLIERLLSAGAGSTVTPTVLVTLAYEAVKLTDVGVVTLLVVSENAADVEPGGTVMERGTLATATFELESVMTAPPEPATEVRLMVPVPDVPPTIVLGLTEIVVRAAGGGSTVRSKVSLTPE
jgi:hypothetical protein